MMAITREEVVAIFGPVDDEFVADLRDRSIGRGAWEAWGWLHNDER